MKYNVTRLEEKNEPVDSVLGNYFIELEPGNYQAEEASNTSDTQPDLIRGILGSKMGLLRKIIK